MIEYFNGIALIVGDSHICRWIKESGRLDHDTNVLPRVLHFVPENGVVIDAGGFCGDQTVAYANKVGINGKVIAFEPFPEAFQCLEHNMKESPQVICENMALGNRNGFVKPIALNENFGMAIVEDLSNDIENVGEINIAKLDSYIETFPYEFTQLDFLKIDTEGFEIDVLQGAKQTIEKFKPVMFIEVNEHTLKAKGYTKNDLLQTIHDLGYTYRNVYEEQGLDDEQFDVLCFPK